MPEIIELNIGPDKVHLIGDRVTIFASREMPDWTVREFSRLPIWFQGVKYFLKRKTPGPKPYAFHYELAPWNSEPGLESPIHIAYDAAYVAERDRSHGSHRGRELLHPALVCIYPLLGFAWSGFKQRVLGPLGFAPDDITGISIFFAVCCGLLEALFIICFHGGLLAFFCGPGWLYDAVVWLDRALLVLLPMDSVMRYSQLIRGDEEFDGFLEWAFRAFFKRKP